MQPLDLVFAGTPDFAARHLEVLINSHHRVIAVYTQPDRRSGRGNKLQISPVKSCALSHGIPIYQPASLKEAEAQQQLAHLNADLMVVVAYGLILPQAVLDIPRFGCVNVHASLLPRWRGAAPIERAILAGDSATGVTIMQMDAGLDTGPMLLQQEVAIDADDSRESVQGKLAELGTHAILTVLDDFVAFQAQAVKQDDGLATYANKITKPESAIDWHRHAFIVRRQVAAGIGRYPAFSYLQGLRVRILDARVRPSAENAPPGTILAASKEGLFVRCGEDQLQITRIQLPGKNPVSIGEALNAYSQLLRVGNAFSSSEDG